MNDLSDENGEDVDGAGTAVLTVGTGADGVVLVADDDGSGIRTAVIELETVTAHERNYNYHPQEQTERLEASLGEFGYVRRIVVQEKVEGGYTAVAGHGVIDALVIDGYRNVEATIIPADWQAHKVLAYLVADNMLPQGAVVQDDLLQEILRDIAIDGGAETLEVTGVSQEEVDGILAGIGAGDEDGIDPSLIPGEDRYAEQYGVIVLCADAAEQEQAYNDLLESGYNCKVVTT